MKRRIYERAAGRRGVALLYAVLGLMAAATMVSMMLTMTLSSGRVAQTQRNSVRARFLAEGGIEAAVAELRTAIANWRPAPGAGSAVIDGTGVDWTIQPTGFNDVVTDAAGIQTIVTGYQLSADAAVEGFAARANRLVNTEATPIFQFAVFYDGDLEINPGPNMTLGGRVHSNRDIYLNCGGTLSADTNYLRAVGNIYRSRKDDPGASQGAVRVRRWVANPFDVTEPSTWFGMPNRAWFAGRGIPSTSGYDSRFTSGWDQNGDGDFTGVGDWLPWGPGALAYWSEPPGYMRGTGHTILSSAHGVTEAAVPQIGSIRMFESDPNGNWTLDPSSGRYVHTPGAGTHSKGFYHAEADLSVITYADGTVRAFDGSGGDVTGAVRSALAVETMYDARQANGGGGRVRLTEIDLISLAATGRFPQNGLLYAAHYGAGTGISSKGVRLVRGRELRRPLTVVSENAVYIKGDYNTTDKKGAAVIADAVNLLSNAWNDSKTRGSLPAASNTTFNVAMISGNQQTRGSRYNGGLENLPRFHENWSGRTCTIRGSLVNTWESAHATGAWAYGGDRYTAPDRNWTYDTTFNVVANLPPYTPMAVTVRDVVSW